MAISPKVLNNVKIDLYKGLSVKAIASKYDIGRSSIYTIRESLDKTDLEATIIDTAKATPRALDVIAKAVEANIGTVPADFALEVEATIDSLKSLQLLEVKVHETLRLALDKATAMLNSDSLSIVEWQIVVSTISTCHKDIFSKGSVTNNLINGDMVGSKKGDSLTMFQSRMAN